MLKHKVVALCPGCLIQQEGWDPVIGVGSSGRDGIRWLGWDPAGAVGFNGWGGIKVSILLLSFQMMLTLLLRRTHFDNRLLRIGNHFELPEELSSPPSLSCALGVQGWHLF